MALLFNFLVRQHLQIPLLCTVNFQAYQSYLPKWKIRKLSFSAAFAARRPAREQIHDFISFNQTWFGNKQLEEKGFNPFFRWEGWGGKLCGHQWFWFSLVFSEANMVIKIFSLDYFCFMINPRPGHFASLRLGEFPSILLISFFPVSYVELDNSIWMMSI